MTLNPLRWYRWWTTQIERSMSAQLENIHMKHALLETGWLGVTDTPADDIRALATAWAESEAKRTRSPV